MFASAVKLAMNFTQPVVISIRRVDGTCSGAVGTCVIVNKDGWLVTAAHIFKKLSELTQAEAQTRTLQAQAKGKIDPSLPRHERRRLAALAKGPSPEDVDKWSVWWGNDAWSLDTSSTAAIEPADIAIGRINAFDPRVWTHNLIQ